MKVRRLATLDPDRRIEYWHDRRARSWVAATYDARGNQIGDATYVGTKSAVLADVDERRDEINRERQR